MKIIPRNVPDNVDYLTEGKAYDATIKQPVHDKPVQYIGYNITDDYGVRLLCLIDAEEMKRPCCPHLEDDDGVEAGYWELVLDS